MQTSMVDTWPRKHPRCDRVTQLPCSGWRATPTLAPRPPTRNRDTGGTRVGHEFRLKMATKIVGRSRSGSAFSERARITLAVTQARRGNLMLVCWRPDSSHRGAATRGIARGTAGKPRIPDAGRVHGGRLGWTQPLRLRSPRGMCLGDTASRRLPGEGTSLRQTSCLEGRQCSANWPLAIFMLIF